MTQKVTTLEEFSFVFEGTVIRFIQLYDDCWICSLPDINAQKLKNKIEFPNVSIDQLELTVRANNVLITEGIYEVSDLLSRTANELLKLPNCGKVTVNEIKTALAGFGLELRNPYDHHKQV